jgi:hypothetical protein
MVAHARRRNGPGGVSGGRAPRTTCGGVRYRAEMQPAPPPYGPVARPPRPGRTFLIVATIAAIGLSVLSLGPILMSFFLFDAPGSENNPYVLTMAWSIWLFPVACVAAIALGWTAYLLKQPVLARVVFILPLANVVAFVTGMALLSKGCGGNFAC